MEPHPHLSDQINAAMAQSEKDGGIFTRDVPENSVVLVKTWNSLYTLAKRNGRWEGQGGGMLQEAKAIHINGSTFGGSILKVGFIGVGMHLEVIVQGDKELEPPTGKLAALVPGRNGNSMFTTSAISSIRIVEPEER